MSAISRSWRIALVLSVALPLYLPASPLWAQVSGGAADANDRGPLGLFGQQVRASAGGISVAQEGPVDPDTYVVGPGDVFGVSISGLESVNATIPVGADGALLLPEAGAVRVAGQPLRAVIDEVSRRLQSRFSKVEIAVTLAAPRQFYVHVVGAVTSPGRYLVAPVSRVSDALMLAYRDTARAAVGNPEFRPALRNIAVRRIDGNRVTADVMSYLASGATDLNPYLQDGDVITVPAFDPRQEGVSISGRVAFPGIYDLRPGESVRDLLRVAGGMRDAGLEGEVRVSRATAAGRTDERVSLDGGGGADFLLRARDHVFVLPEELLDGFASVEGRVRFPGSYPVTAGKTTLGDLVQMAGGFRDDALLRGAYLVRDLPTEEPKAQRLARESARQVAGSATGRAPDAFWSQDLLTSPSAEALRTLRLSGLDYSNRVYLAQEVALTNRVSLDLESEKDATVLMDSDRLIIPRDEGTVFVFGQVSRGGFVPVAGNSTAADFIRAAGGTGPGAGDVFVIEAGSRRFLPASGAPVASGDMVFVSRKREVADFAEMQRLALEEKRSRADARGRIVSGVLQAISAVATTIALIVTLRRN